MPKVILGVLAAVGVVFVVGPAQAGVRIWAEGTATARASAAAVPTVVSVSISASECRVAPAQVPAGAVLFTIRNRSRVAQRFAIAARTSRRLRPGGGLRYLVTLDDPGVYSYRCVPRRGAVGRGSLRVAHNVVVETDMSADDAMALLYLLRRADVEVAAIVVDGDGESRCPIGATNALSLTALAGKPRVPVGCGRPRPLQGNHAFPEEWRDFADKLWGLPRPAKPAHPRAGSGEHVFRAAIQSAPGRVEVLTLGPPTELAALLSADAALGGKIRSVTMMGGAVGVPGNITSPEIRNPYAEWNFYIDPHAANVVLRSGLAITLVPLDATNDVPLNAAVAARLGRSPSAAFVRRLIESLLPSTFYFWDPLAAAVLVEPAIGRYANKRLAVIEQEGQQSGRMVQAADGARVHVRQSGSVRALIRLDSALRLHGSHESPRRAASKLGTGFWYRSQRTQLDLAGRKRAENPLPYAVGPCWVDLQNR
jgi:inosine-uridine nucleoside N-ribohydrolase